jgi:parallel beta-helix repeat protein
MTIDSSNIRSGVMGEYRMHTLALLAIVTGLLISVPGVFGASVADFGAKGDGETNDTQAFQKAFASGDKDIYVPPGTYLLGPEELSVGKATYLHGAGRASIIKVAEGTGKLLTLDQNVRLERLHFDGKGAKQGGVADGLVVLPGSADNVVIDSVSFADCDRACIVTDHADHLVVSNCDFRKVGLAISIQFSSHIKVLGNTVIDARVHGIQFWGNWKWSSKEIQDLIIANNYVKNGGGGPIWGTGATRVIITGNVIDGAHDVGLDLEWCDDSVISGNTVRNCQNAGISLFFMCKRVAITGNTVINDNEITAEEAKKSWYVRSGIWLTPPNRETFKQDTGHEDISIVGNVIRSAKGARRGMWIGAEVKNVTIESNVISGPGILYGGHHAVQPVQLAEVKQPIVLDDKPTPDEPKF